MVQSYFHEDGTLWPQCVELARRYCKLGARDYIHPVSKKRRLPCIINVAKQFNLHKTKEQLLSFTMILFLNRNDENWPDTRQIKIAGRNHLLPPLGIAWKTKHRQFPRGN